MPKVAHALKALTPSSQKNFTEKQKIKILQSILSDGMKSQPFSLYDPEARKIKAAQKELNSARNLGDAIFIVQRFIKESERTQGGLAGVADLALIKYFNEKGVYRILNLEPQILEEIPVLKITARSVIVGVLTFALFLLVALLASTTPPGLAVVLGAFLGGMTGFSAFLGDFTIQKNAYEDAHSKLDFDTPKSSPDSDLCLNKDMDYIDTLVSEYNVAEDIAETPAAPAPVPPTEPVHTPSIFAPPAKPTAPSVEPGLAAADELLRLHRNDDPPKPQ